MATLRAGTRDGRGNSHTHDPWVEGWPFDRLRCWDILFHGITANMLIDGNSVDCVSACWKANARLRSHRLHQQQEGDRDR